MFDFLNPLSNVLSSEPVFFIFVSVLFGLMVGSFLNVVIHRLPKMMEREWHNNCLELQGKDIPEQTKFTLSIPRSACPICNNKIAALE